MIDSFAEFKFFQAYRIKVEKADNLKFMIQAENEWGKVGYVDDATLIDISRTGLGFSTMSQIKVGTHVDISVQFKKQNLALTGSIVRAFSNTLEDEEIIYGIELDEDTKIPRLIASLIHSFSTERLRDCLTSTAVDERYTDANHGFETFSLLLSLFRDISHYGKNEGFVEHMLEEVTRVMNAQRASVYLINPEKNELEAAYTLGMSKEHLKFDYRQGISGSVFTTGIPVNLNMSNSEERILKDKEIKGLDTRSIICHPIHNREDKVIGVIEVMNKRNQPHFSVEDEKTMKVLSIIFSSVFHRFNPISEQSSIRLFSTPFDRKHVIIGRTPVISALRKTIVKLKDLDSPVLINGEKGVGKNLYAQILHHEGNRGLNKLEIINCQNPDTEALEKELFSLETEENKFFRARGGVVILQNVNALSYSDQERLSNFFATRTIPGSHCTFDCRIIATANEKICEEVDKGEFHRELYSYISKAFVSIEPLRRRKDDIKGLVDYFLKAECKKQGLLLKSFSDEAIQTLSEHDWPGNIRELKTCVERIVLYNPRVHIISDLDVKNHVTPIVDVDAKKRMFGNIPHASDNTLSLKDRVAIIERELILTEIKRHNGNKSKAAKNMGISREALRKKLIISEGVIDKIEQSTTQDRENVIDLDKATVPAVA